jgi:hypothetical protein
MREAVGHETKRGRWTTELDGTAVTDVLSAG